MVSNNSARATTANGGGVFARSGLLTKYSTLTGNDAACAVGFGGGAYVGAYGDTNVFYSTIDTNSSCQHAGGLYVSSSSSHHLFISNSTISGNWTDAGDGGGVLFGNVPATILNSTIALNHAGDSGGGIAQCCVSVAITFESSIVANNTAGDPAMSDDISLSPSSNITGHDNLVRTSSPQPPSGVIKVAADPKLKLLQLNGGITKTHALFPDSPARGQGNDLGNSQTDQRGPGYPRATGASGMVDIGAFEFDSIFADNFES